MERPGHLETIAAQLLSGERVYAKVTLASKRVEYYGRDAYCQLKGPYLVGSRVELVTELPEGVEVKE